MKYKYLNNDKISELKASKALVFLYNTQFGRFFLKIIYNTLISKFIGFILNRRISRLFIKSYVKKNNIDLSLYEEKKYKSFNDFFIRKIKNIKKINDNNAFISNCDCYISIYSITDDLILNIKNSKYSIESLIQNKEMAKEFSNGYAVIYRLEPSNYHRYIYVDNGKMTNHKKIKGKLHTVNPIVYDKYKVFAENTREISVLETSNFGKIIQIEVGALCVGKIKNNYKKDYNRYEEKGYFEFGGSTIIHLIKKDSINFDTELISNSKNNIETRVNIGDIIGRKKIAFLLKL